MLALALLAPATARAQGGPPLITDDPDTPGPGHWEINLAASRETNQSGTTVESLADINVGVGRRLQLKLEAPWAAFSPVGSARVSGPGDAIAGVKWRFLGEEGQRISWAVYPQYQFNLSSASAQKGLVSKGHRLLLATELTLEIHRAELNLDWRSVPLFVRHRSLQSHSSTESRAS